MPWRGQPGHGNWLRNIPKPARDRIHAIINKHGPSTERGQKDYSIGYWVRVSPTTQTARNVTLLRKSAGIVTREWEILRNGDLCEM
jgi:hypothetical protein